jgi:hypothetical protein
MSQMPDKIWLHKNTKYSTVDEVFGYQYEYAQEIMCEGIENFVKYVPANTFIERACEFIAENMTCNGYTLQTKAKFIKEFKDYMKGE